MSRAQRRCNSESGTNLSLGPKHTSGKSLMQCFSSQGDRHINKQDQKHNPLAQVITMIVLIKRFLQYQYPNDRPSHWEHDVMSMLNQRRRRWLNIAITPCFHWNPTCVCWIIAGQGAWFSSMKSRTHRFWPVFLSSPDAPSRVYYLRLRTIGDNQGGMDTRRSHGVLSFVAGSNDEARAGVKPAPPHSPGVETIIRKTMPTSCQKDIS